MGVKRESLAEFVERSGRRKSEGCAVCALPAADVKEIDVEIGRGATRNAVTRWVQEVLGASISKHHVQRHFNHVGVTLSRTRGVRS